MCVFYIVIGILCACVRWALDGHWKSSVWDQKDNKRYFFSRFCHIRVFSKKKEKVWTGFRKSRWKCESSIGPGGLVTRPLSPMAIYWQVSYKWSDINATRTFQGNPRRNAMLLMLMLILLIMLLLLIPRLMLMLSINKTVFLCLPLYWRSRCWAVIGKVFYEIKWEITDFSFDLQKPHNA